MRVLTALELLQERESISGAELARRMEISPRTVQRYIARLQDLGIPVEGKRGAGGTYRLKPGFRIPPMMFNSEEASSIALGLLALRQLGLAQLIPAAESAAAKLKRILPQHLREEVEAIKDAVQFDTSKPIVPASAQLLSELLQAIRAQQTVELCYLSQRTETSRREVNMYRVLQWGGRWYAMGFCHARKAMRAFRIDRIQELQRSQKTFVAPAHFDAIDFIRTHSPEPASTLHHISVWLRPSPQEFNGRISTWGTELSEENGGTRLKAQRDDLQSFAAMLLGLGCEFRIDEPTELLDAIKVVVAKGQEFLQQLSDQ